MTAARGTLQASASVRVLSRSSAVPGDTGANKGCCHAYAGHRGRRHSGGHYCVSHLRGDALPLLRRPVGLLQKHLRNVIRNRCRLHPGRASTCQGLFGLSLYTTPLTCSFTPRLPRVSPHHTHTPRPGLHLLPPPSGMDVLLTVHYHNEKTAQKPLTGGGKRTHARTLRCLCLLTYVFCWAVSFIVIVVRGRCFRGTLLSPWYRGNPTFLLLFAHPDNGGRCTQASLVNTSQTRKPSCVLT